MKKCNRCGEDHEGTFGSGKYCSRSCANKRTHSKETIEKIKNSLRAERILKECEHCKKEFEVTQSRIKQTTCSKSCSAKIHGRGWTNHDKVDWSKVNKKAYADGNNYVAGGTTPWIKYKDIKVQGSYELQMCKILDAQKKNKEIKDWEYSTVRVKYNHEGKVRTYLIDFTVINNDDTRKCIEVKGRETELDKIKWKAARSQGIILEVWRKADLFNETVSFLDI